MVITCLPATLETEVEHERIGCPFTCTVQAPHSAMPQPYLVPVKPSESRNTHSKGIAGTASTVCGLPLSVNWIAAIGILRYEYSAAGSVKYLCMVNCFEDFGARLHLAGGSACPTNAQPLGANVVQTLSSF